MIYTHVIALSFTPVCSDTKLLNYGFQIYWHMTSAWALIWPTGASTAKGNNCRRFPQPWEQQKWSLNHIGKTMCSYIASKSSNSALDHQVGIIKAGGGLGRLWIKMSSTELCMVVSLLFESKERQNRAEQFFIGVKSLPDMHGLIYKHHEQGSVPSPRLFHTICMWEVKDTENIWHNSYFFSRLCFYTNFHYAN